MTLVATPSQREMWHLDRYTEAGSTLNVPIAWRLRGELDANRLSHAVRTVIARHESLRAAFAEGDDGVVRLTIAPPPAEPLEMAKADGEEQAEERLETVFGEALDLESGRPIAALLVRLSATEHILALSVHHAVLDEWSIEIIERDLSRAYQEGAGADQEGAGADRTRPYRLADVLAGMAAARTGAKRAADLAYWIGELHGIEGRLEFPGATPNPGSGAILVRRSLPATVAKRVERLARECGTTPFGLLLAAFSGVLGRRVNSDDFVIGVPVADRTTEASQHAVLYTTNLAPLRVRLVGNPSFAHLAGLVRDQLLSALEHSSVSLAEIIAAAGGAAGHDVAAMGQVAVTYRARTGTALDLVGMTVTPVAVQTGRSLYPLALNIEHGGGSIDLTIESRILPAGALDDLATRYLTTLSFVVESPSTRLADWPTTQPVDHVPCRTEPVVIGETVVDAFVSAADHWPDTPAAVDRKRTVTYAELRDVASAVGTRLVGSGSRPGEVVAVAVRRGVAALSGMLGVMQAAGVYLPVDLDWPKQRMRTVMADSGVTHVVRDAASARHPAFVGMVGVDAMPPVGPATPRLLPRAIPDDPAYVIYTSGSTGKPKGVQVGHAALTQLITAMRDEFGTKPGQRLLATTTTTFDISLAELLLPLTTGAICVIADEDTVRDPALAGALIAAQRIDFAQGTPTWWALVVDHLPVRIPVIVVAGEPLPPKLRDRLLRASVRAFNGYGPTEATIYATIWPLEPDVPVAIGQPVDGTTAWVLDRWERPCAIGSIGRLFLGGTGVGIGYLHRPQLTAERFRDGIPGLTADRLYDTGDLAAWGDDGQLYLYGRSDDQIKLRGYRIELGEIESVIAGVGGVGAAAVVPFVRGEHQQGLAAFVRAAPSLEPEIRAALSEQLPEYMRPHVIQFVDALPATDSGKTDRTTLAGMIRFGDTADAAPDEPLSAAEERVADVFRTVLGIDHVRAGDRFFDLGGDSIGAAQVLVRIRRQFGVPMTLREFVDDPTVVGMVRRVGA